MDVTNPDDRARVVAAILAKQGRIDGLVNNAGFGAILAQEDTSEEVLRSMFDVNVFGLHAMTLLVIPAMRKQGSGRIVNIASIAGHMSVPMMGSYCATKFAVRAMTQALRNETRTFGIYACLIEPGLIRTNFGKRTQTETRAAIDDAKNSPYKSWYARWRKMRENPGGAHPRVIARRITHACLSQRPRFHYLGPVHAKALNLLNRWTPDFVFNGLYRLYFRARL